MQNRRDFIRGAAALSAIMASGPSAVRGQGAPRVFKVGMIGSGRRACAAFQNMKAAAQGLGAEIRLAAAHDFFLDQARAAAAKLGCDEKFTFGGATGYRELLGTDCEIVILATPPAFRPIHVSAAVAAGKHVFAEKPVAVDPPGVRQFLAAAAGAKKKGVSLVAGTQRRHQGAYIQQAMAIKDGQLGRILGGAIYWCQARGSIRPRRETDTNAAYVANNWMNWAQMSGDHIVEQHVHNIDVANWFVGRSPISAIGVGSRLRRPTGNQYDFFSVDFDYGEGLHIHSLSRQVPGCYNRIGESLQTDVAEIMGGGKIRRFDGRAVNLEPVGHEGDPYILEHADLLKGLLEGPVLNEGENVAMSTATAIMGRMSAYTGQIVRMSDLLTSAESPFYNMAFKPAAADFEAAGDIALPQENVAPVAGKDA